MMHFTHGRHLQSLRKQEMGLAGVFTFFFLMLMEYCWTMASNFYLGPQLLLESLLYELAFCKLL